jgi:hypothetical protein
MNLKWMMKMRKSSVGKEEITRGDIHIEDTCYPLKGIHLLKWGIILGLHNAISVTVIYRMFQIWLYHLGVAKTKISRNQNILTEDQFL